ncbi:hypothetical protein TK1485 [Thermococcus kodakarensis KOD1]|uniref:Uncharacterized protein n=1 Tax=Thermococcus kodakarensis (strain ATCC BAA-918 / JCM 12380 / KOD1) TaxID=69014 RepID=Q5JJB5_THEKO|nr:hypothetical protein TK1485 [Thermococcus kodakarensis KOD1]
MLPWMLVYEYMFTKENERRKRRPIPEELEYVEMLRR